MLEIPQLFLSFLSAALLINLLPGSDRVYIVATSMRHGMRGGWHASLGVTTGIFIHSIIGSYGLGALIHSYPMAFNIIRLSGIAVLFLLGLQYWFQNPESVKIKKMSSHLNSPYWQGLLVHLLNPIAIVFTFTFIPQFIDVNGNFVWQFLFLSATSNLMSLMVNGITVVIIQGLRERIRIDETRVRIISGLILIGLSIKICYDWVFSSP